MELVLYRLGIAGLAASTLLIAVFFFALGRTLRRAEVRWWSYAWAADAVALAITTYFWYAEPPPQYHRFVFGGYLLSKSAYVWLLVRGALELVQSRPRYLTSRYVIPTLTAVCVIGALYITTRNRLGVVTQVFISAGFGWAAVTVARVPQSGAVWLIIGLAVRAAHSLAEAAAYTQLLIAGDRDPTFFVPASRLIAAHGTFDTALGWLLAMGCVLAVSERTQRALRQANDQMIAAQSDLRRLADRDPLTGLANRRTLPEVFRAVQPLGATLIFFDLNGFKRINDEHGHQAGDICLKRFADALTECFRPSDAVIRFGGDEFLVVAAGLNPAAVETRIEAVRARVRTDADHTIKIQFSYGVGHLAAGGQPDAALGAADEAMYRAKPKTKQAGVA